MSSFRKFDHVTRWPHLELDGIDIGTVYIFPKLDGTNASVWLGEDGEVHAGSRTRELSEEKDNAGFRAWVMTQPLIANMLGARPNWVVYSEWLVPHTVKAYRTDAWRRSWVFDVWDRITERYVPYDDYIGVMQDFGQDYIEPLSIITNPTEEQFWNAVAANNYLMESGAGPGEGVVGKNYDWENKFGRQPWAKFVRTEFKEAHAREFGTCVKTGAFSVEEAIAQKHVTATLVNKIRAKIAVDIRSRDQEEHIDEKAFDNTHRGEIIPRLLQTVYYDVVNEEIWSALKEHKDPTINFKRLRQLCIRATKKVATDLF